MRKLQPAVQEADARHGGEERPDGQLLPQEDQEVPDPVS